MTGRLLNTPVFLLPLPAEPTARRDGGRPGGNNNYYDMLELEKDPAFTKYRDASSQSPYLYSKSKGEFYTYEDEISAKFRADYVKNNDYGGIIMWQASSDGPTVDKRDVLTTVFKDTFYSGRANSSEGQQFLNRQPFRTAQPLACRLSS